MKRAVTHALALALTLAMTLALLTVPALAAPVSGFDAFQTYKEFDGQFWDVKKTDWYYPILAEVYGMGLMQGKGTGTFLPSGPVSRAEALAVVCNIHNRYYGSQTTFVSGDLWYWCYVIYALDNGIIQDGQFDSFDKPATHGDLAQIFGGLPYEMLKEINSIEDGSIPDVSILQPCRAYAYRLYRAGVTTGYGWLGNFCPDSPTTRLELASVILRLVRPEQRVHKDMMATLVPVYSDNGKLLGVPAVDVPVYHSWNWQDAPFTLTGTKEQQMNAASLQPMKTNDAELDALVDAVFAQIFTPGMTTYQKVRAIYDYLVNTTENGYNDSGWNWGYANYNDAAVVDNAKALLTQHLGVCVDYSAAFQVMTRRLGLDCYIYAGDTSKAGGGYTSHEWNVIRIGGNDYVFDAQVDDQMLTRGDTHSYLRFFRPLWEVQRNYTNYTQTSFGEFQTW